MSDGTMRQVRVATKYRRLYPRGARFTWHRRRADARLLTAAQVRAARAFHRDHGFDAHGQIRVVVVPLYPFLHVDADTRPCKPPVMRALNAVGRRLKRHLRIREGWRTRDQQQAFWEAFEDRGYRPPLVARPGTSNHETGDAADVGVLPSGENLGSYGGARQAMRAEGLCLPVPGEPWHVEIGTTWRA
jgi:hypothetical protein